MIAILITGRIFNPIMNLLYAVLLIKSEQLGFIVATLLDMDEVDGRSGASLLAECATSPDVETRYVSVNVSILPAAHS